MCLQEGSIYLESSEVTKVLKAGASRIDSGSITSVIKQIKASVLFLLTYIILNIFLGS